MAIGIWLYIFECIQATSVFVKCVVPRQAGKVLTHLQRYSSKKTSYV